MSEKNTVIAVDGPAASGKSTVSKMVAAKLGFNHVDTGAMYRSVTWKAIESGVNLEDPAAVVAMLTKTKVTFEVVDGSVRMLLDGVFPGDAVRAPRVADKVSIIAAMPGVRKILVDYQRSLADMGNVVMEGRDIGSVVFPDTPHKFFIQADPAIRAQRRQKDLAALNINTSHDAVAQNLQKRDQIDSQRKTSPLQIAPGATLIDTTFTTPEECMEIVLGHLKQQRMTRGSFFAQ
jgi:cytidylate kinase